MLIGYQTCYTPTMKPSLSRFDAIHESREYVFDYDDTERLCLRVEERPNGLFAVLLATNDSMRWQRLHSYDKWPTLAKLAKTAAAHILLRKAGCDD